jgi:aminomethyltransferase
MLFPSWMALGLEKGMICLEPLKRTPLFPVYEKYGGKTVAFGGWEMPVQFSGILEEHEAVRTCAGLFDVSHMGEITVTGEGARSFLQYVVTNDMSRLQPGRILYTPVCYPNGGTVDDILIYCKDESHFLLVVNAANTEKDFAWFRACLTGEKWRGRGGSGLVALRDCSAETVQLALQGPKAEAILQPLCDASVGKSQLPYYRFIYPVEVAGVECLISRTGYTGEDGFELYTSPEKGIRLWNALLEAGRGQGLLPCGLGARDTLRLEARLPLYGHELTEHITPVEAGLDVFVKPEKGDFIGRDILIRQKENGPERRIVGIEMTGRGVPRQGYAVWRQGEEVGVVTSGTFSPTLRKNIGLALVRADCAEIGNTLDVMIRNKPVASRIVKTPFYRRT